MSNNLDINKLTKQAIDIADERIRNVANGVVNDLRRYATIHKRSGDLADNIKMRERKQKKLNYVIDGGERALYKDKTYHPITFFIHEPGKKALSQVLDEARKSIKRGK